MAAIEGSHSPERLTSRKRQRLHSPVTEHTTSQDEDLMSSDVDDEDTVFPGFNVEASVSNLEATLVHTVQCGKDLPGHESHTESITFLDQPRLFIGDSRASALRGEQRLPDDVLGHFETHDDLNLIIERAYYCEDFHDSVSESFTKLPRPNHPPIPAQVRPYFYFLPETSDIPHAADETIIPSPSLETAMDELTKHDDTFKTWRHGLSPPFLGLWAHRERLTTLAEEHLSPRLCERVRHLVTYITKSSQLEYQEAEQLFSTGHVTKEHLAKLFRSGDVIVWTEDGEPRAAIVEEGPISNSSELFLKCFSWTFDGQFRKSSQTLEIQWPGGRHEAIPIDSLDIFPLRFDSSEKLESDLRSRGLTLWRCRTRCLMGYDAPSPTFEVQISNSRYMLDDESYHKLHRKEKEGSEDQFSLPGDLSDEAFRAEAPPSDPFLLLLPARMLGFGLHDKIWRNLLIKHLHPVQWQKDSFNQLVLDQHKKDLVQAMIEVHISSNMSSDVIEGKGKGLIILLHGGPGTGKTLTAESVAELTERPLYRVTCSDISTDPDSVEEYLQSILHIGITWKAGKYNSQSIILLDESDVFLEAREKNDLQRNALVSIFLRILEYYEGILILTSNRIGTFDEAFKSRVQLAIHYPPLDEKGRLSIWNNFFRLLSKQRKDPTSVEPDTIELDGDETIHIAGLWDKLKVLAQEKLNGRQIRNAIMSTRQLARFRGVAMGYTHLEQTIRVVNEFETYVEKTQGHKDDEFMRQMYIRG